MTLKALTTEEINESRSFVVEILAAILVCRP